MVSTLGAERRSGEGNDGISYCIEETLNESIRLVIVSNSGAEITTVDDKDGIVCFFEKGFNESTTLFVIFPVSAGVVGVKIRCRDEDIKESTGLVTSCPFNVELNC